MKKQEYKQKRESVLTIRYTQAELECLEEERNLFNQKQQTNLTRSAFIRKKIFYTSHVFGVSREQLEKQLRELSTYFAQAEMRLKKIGTWESKQYYLSLIAESSSILKQILNALKQEEAEHGGNSP